MPLSAGVRGLLRTAGGAARSPRHQEFALPCSQGPGCCQSPSQFPPLGGAHRGWRRIDVLHLEGWKTKRKKKKKGRQRTEKWLSVSYLWLFHRPLRGYFIQGHSQSCLWTPLCRELGVQPDLLFTHPSPVWQRTELPHGVGWEEGRWVRGRLCCRGDVRRCPWAQHCAPITCSLGTPFSLLHQKPLLLFFLLWQWDAQHGWCSSPTTGVGCTVPAGRQHLGQHCHSHTPWISEQKHCFHVHGVSSEEIFL